MLLKKVNKTILIVISTLVIIAGLIILFISPIAKYLIEKYDEEYTGRQIKMDWAYVNPFTGYIYLSDLKIYELKSDSVFLSADGISANFSLRKMFSKTYEINQLALIQPKITFIQNKNKHDLNINDIIDRFSPTKKDTVSEPIHFSILKIILNDGVIYYHENVIPINYSVKKVNIESDGVRWDSDTISSRFSFLSGMGNGEMNGIFSINTKNLDYLLSVSVKKYDLNIIEQYLKDLSNYGSFVANLDANIKATGNFNNARVLDAKGKISINDFHFGKNKKDDYASFNRFTLGISDLNPAKQKYIFDSVILDNPFFKYEMYDHLDNIQMMFGKNGSNVTAVHQNVERFNVILEIADYVEKLAKNFFHSYYKIDRLKINSADFEYADYSTNEKFCISADPLFVTADSIDKNKKRVNLYLKSNIKPYGNASVNLSINPKDSGDFDLNYYFEKISMPNFNPYLITYTSFPLNKGSMELKGKWHVRNGKIESDNHLIIIDPHIARRIKRKNAKWIPVPLIMAFIRERGNVIDYEIPITGDLKNPKFHLWNVFFHLIENIIIKPPTFPYIVHVKIIEKEIEKSQYLIWSMGQSELRPYQEKFIYKIAEFLKENPNVSISISPVQYAEKEKENILFFVTKKKYFLFNKKIKYFNKEDSLIATRMSIKDSGFVKYLNKYNEGNMIFTIQGKCQNLIGSDIVNKKFDELLKQRENIVMSYFKKNGTDKQIKINSSKNEIPFNGFSYFKISYYGDAPKSLEKAYKKLEEMNEEPPRDKYFELRKKIRNMLK